MIQFPILQELSVGGYSMYPGVEEGRAGLEAQFLPGLTLVIGANGLGKSTLVTLLYRMMAGNAEISGLGYGSMGSGQVNVRELSISEVRTFVTRVDDGARDAKATVQFTLGSRQIRATRSLATLTLTELNVDGEDLEAEETEFRRAIIDASEVDTYLSWLLVLRYVVFYSDDRRSLVWDPTAQRRLLPLLLLPPGETRPIEELTKDILQKDSQVRNLATVLTRRERELREQERAESSMPVVMGELRTLIPKRAELEEQSAALQAELVHAAATQASARLEYLRRSDEELSCEAELHQARMLGIQRSFPSADETAAYLLTHLVSEQECLVCGQGSANAADLFAERLVSRRCVLCDSKLAGSVAAEPSDPGIPLLKGNLESAQKARLEADAYRRMADTEHHRVFSQLALAQKEAAELDVRIERLESSLPESERSASKLRDGLAELRAYNDQMKADVIRSKEQLARLVEAQNLRLSAFREDIKRAFETHAEGFLVETCELIWASNVEKVGQLGPAIGYSVFQVDMTAGARTMSRREDASQVSESQREFIDLAFRMALMGVAGEGGTGSLVVDAPESSLDAVFAPRAADVLTSFRGVGGTARVVITSNLVDGQLIPKLALLSNIASLDDPRIVNLFKLAAPTAAIRELRSDYDAALDRVFTKPGGDGDD